MEPTLKIYVAGQIDKISPETMAEAFSAFVALLDTSNSGINWQMKQLSLGSLTMAATPTRSTNDVDQAKTDEEIAREFKEIVSALDKEGDEKPLSKERREALEKLENLTTAPGVESITATVAGRTFPLAPRPKDTFKSFRKISIGSVTGKIDRINTRDGCEFGLIDETERHPVKVRFKKQELENIKSLMGKLVRVRGKLTRNQQGRKESLQMLRIEEIADHADLPTFDDLVGIWQAPRQAMSAEEIVQEIRRA